MIALIKDLLEKFEEFIDQSVILFGYLVVEQVMDMSNRYYIRDESNNMVELRFTKDIELSDHAGKKMRVCGIFKVRRREMFLEVSHITL